MHRSFASLAITFGLCAAPALAEHSTSVNIPAGTQIRMYVVGDVDAKGTNAGDSFEARAARDVIVDGLVVVRKGADGHGTIGEVKRAGGRTASNALALTFDWVYAADGTKIRLSTNDQNQPVAAKRAAATLVVETPASVATFGLAGYFGIVSAFAKESTSVKTSTPSDGQ